MRKVLIITYYWPPSGGVGVQRWLKFSKYLPTHGWSPVIYTPSNPDFDLKDESLVSQVSEELTVLRRPIWEPFQLYKRVFGSKGATTRQGMVKEGDDSSLLERLTIWIRGNLFVPDARKFWVKPSVRFLNRYLEHNPVDLIVTTGPPHSMHLIGHELKARTGIKWVADFRDPWTDWDVLPRLKTSESSMRKHQRLERKVLEACDLLITVSPRLKAILSLESTQCEVITNGYDFSSLSSDTFPEKFRISHAGLLNETKFHPLFWEVLEELVEEDPGFRNDLEITLAGNVSQSIMNRLRNSSLGDKLIFKGFIDHADILPFYKDSFVLLLFLNLTESAPFLLPSKVFEYIKSERYILGFGPQASDSHDLLVDFGMDGLMDYDDRAAIKNRLKNYYSLFKEGRLPPVSSKVEDYSRASTTAKLSEVFDRIVRTLP